MVKKLFKTDEFTTKIILLLLFLLGILGVSYKLVGLRNIISDKDYQLELLKRDYRLLDDIVADSENRKEDIDKVMATLPQTYLEVGRLAYKIEKSAKDHDLETALLFDKEAKEEDNFKSVDITIDSKGKYQDYSRFLSDLVALPYNVRIDSIIYETVKGETKQQTVLKVYIRK